MEEKSLDNIEISGIGVVSPAGNSPEAVFSAAVAPPPPAKLEFTGKSELDGAVGFFCDMSEARLVLGAMKIRRLGRLQIMSLLAAKKAFLSADIKVSGTDTGVYVGTGLGSLGETAAFLENMIQLGENFPKPANFINSVHNAAASSLALEFSLKGENITVAHREISFDAALWHALSGLKQGRVKNAVVCGADELNYYHVLAGSDKGLWKTEGQPFQPLAPGNSRGTFPGEGAAVCVLSSGGQTGGNEAPVKVLGVKFGRYRRDMHTYINLRDAGDFLERLMDSAGIKASEVDLLLSGADGDARLDAVYLRVGAELARRAGRAVPQGTYKQLCGDYRAASGFGFVAAAQILRTGRAPAGFFPGGQDIPDGSIKTILLYAISRSGAHSGCVLGREW
ncbi:MAG: beta-ketoacyl synthase N-terminal-like domain-containing protein [Elusimicrobiota bacterium]